MILEKFTGLVVTLATSMMVNCCTASVRARGGLQRAGAALRRERVAGARARAAVQELRARQGECASSALAPPLAPRRLRIQALFTVAQIRWNNPLLLFKNTAAYKC